MRLATCSLGKENISLTLTLKADNLLNQLESNSYPNIFNQEDAIVLDFFNGHKSLKIYVYEKEVKGIYFEDEVYIEEYAYLDVNKVQNLINRHGM